MPFFQNVFDQEYRGNLVVSDRQYNLTFVVASNKGGGGEYICAFNAEPYDFSVTTDSVLTIRYNPDPLSLKTFHTLDIDLSGITTAADVVDELNSDAIFADFFRASIYELTPTNNSVLIRSKRPVTRLRFFVENVGAEEALRFNKKTGIAEIPTYYSRHTIANANNFTDSAGLLIELDPAIAADLAIIREFLSDPAWVAGDLLEDWEMLKGRIGAFTFRKNTYDGSSRLIEVIEFPAGAKVGDFAKKIEYQYVGASTNPSVYTEIPHTLVSADLVTPP